MKDPFRSLKNAFARYPTGVTVVSCLPPGKPAVAITVNSFTSLSLDPSLVLWCLADATSVFSAFEASSCYAVSILSADQAALSTRFATPGQHGFADGEGEAKVTGAPLIRGRLAGFDCEVEQRIAVGDHVIMVGRVVHFDSRDGAPLIYSGREYMEGPVISDPAPTDAGH